MPRRLLILHTTCRHHGKCAIITAGGHTFPSTAKATALSGKLHCSSVCCAAPAAKSFGAARNAVTTAAAAAAAPVAAAPRHPAKKAAEHTAASAAAVSEPPSTSSSSSSPSRKKAEKKPSREQQQQGVYLPDPPLSRRTASWSQPPLPPLPPLRTDPVPSRSSGGADAISSRPSGSTAGRKQHLLRFRLEPAIRLIRPFHATLKVRAC